MKLAILSLRCTVSLKSNSAVLPGRHIRTLNKLNLLLYGRQTLLCNVYEAVNGSTGKVCLFKIHAESGNLLYFPFTRDVCGEDEERTKDAKQVLVGLSESLLTDFNERFVDLPSIDDFCCFSASPFTYVKIVADVCLSRTLRYSKI